MRLCCFNVVRYIHRFRFDGVLGNCVLGFSWHDLGGGGMGGSSRQAPN